MLGTSDNPVDVTADEGDKKPIMNPLSRLKPFRLPDKTQLISQNSSKESQIAIKHMKKLLVTEFFSPNNMEIDAMIDRGNGVFDTLAFLQDDDVAFYKAVRSYICWYHECAIADGVRNGLCKKIKDRHDKLECELKEAEECLKSAEYDLSVEKNTVILTREKIRKLEQELVKSEAQVIVLAVEKNKREQTLNNAKDKLMSEVAKTNESAEVLKKIEDRRKAAIKGISEMRNILKPYII